MTKDFNRYYFSRQMFIGATMFLASVGVASASPTALGMNVPESDVFMASPQQAQKTVSGVVEDQFGPVAGANVVEKGTTNGTITDMDGKFTLNVSPNAVLVVSFIGYTEQQITVGNQTSFKIQMKEDSQALDADAASFNTEIVSISCGLTASIEASIPSTKTNGLALFNVPVPRTRIVAPSSVGLPLLCITCKPADRPPKADDTFVIGRLAACSVKSTEETEPVKFTFFCVP